MIKWLFISLFMIITSNAYAFNCDALVNDDAHVISDISKVENQEKSLSNTGLVVRVVTISNLNGLPLDRWADNTRKSCNSWQTVDGHGWRSNLLVILYAPNNEGQFGTYYGQGNEPRLGNNKWRDMAKTDMVPGIKDFRQGNTAGITNGLVVYLSDIQGVFARPSIGGNTVVHQATDLSGLFKVLWGILFFVCLFVGVMIYYRIKGKKDELLAAQAETRRVRSECVSGINEISDSSTIEILKLRVDSAPIVDKNNAQLMLSQYNSYVNSAASDLATFDNKNGADPNAELLSYDVYNSNKAAYMRIISMYINPAKILSSKIMNNDFTIPVKTAQERPVSSSPECPIPPSPVWNNSSSGYSQPSNGYSQPSSTTNIYQGGNNGFVEGMILGELLNHNSYERRHDTENNHSSSSRDSGGSLDTSSSSSSNDSGGSFDTYDSSSSDSGGSFSFDD